MVILNKIVVAPATPPSDWGVERRSLKIRDFSFAIKLAIVALLGLPVMFSSFVADISTPQLNFFGGGMAILVLVGLLSVGSAWMTTGEPTLDAVNESIRRSKKWQTDVLIPFLEEKYGVKFSPYTDFFGLDYAYASYQGRSFPVKLSGVEDYFNYKYGEFYSFRSFKIGPDEITLEEVIHPKQISFRAIPPLD